MSYRRLFAWIPVRKVSGNVLTWFTCITRWRSSCLTFPTPAFVFNAVCESLTNLDAFDFRELYRFMSKHKFSSPCAYLVAISWYVRITSWCIQGQMLSYIFVVVFFFLQTSWKYLFDARWVCRVNFLFNSKIRRFPQFCLCRQLLKKKGVKWTRSDHSLLLCIPGQIVS